MRTWLVVGLLVLAATGPATAAGASSESLGGVSSIADRGVAPALHNNTTVHEDPRGLSATGDLAAVRGWLSGRMGEVLVDCTADLTLATSVACDRLDADYPDWLDRYVELAGGTETREDDQAGDAFEGASRNLRSYRSSLDRFRETRGAYEDARRAGEEARARRLARALGAIASETAQTGETLSADYRTIDETTAVDLEAARADVAATTADVTATARRIQLEQFEETRLVASAEGRAVSFLDPLSIEGRLTTVNGTPVANRTVRLAVGAQDATAETNASGGFALSYRPTRLPVETTRLRLVYRPTNESALLGSNASVPVVVVVVTPEVTVDRAPAEAAFGDRVLVSGRVSAEDVGAAGVPVAVTIGDVPVGTGRTGPDGEFAVRSALPAAVPTGEVPVRATVALTGRALEGTSSATALSVRPTPTELSVTGAAAGGTVDVSGTLVTASGAPVPDQRVSVSANGTLLATVTTGSAGGYSTTLQLPPGRSAILARYDAAGTNLEPSTARTSVRVRSGGDGRRVAPGGALAPIRDALGASTWWQWLGLLVVLLGAGLVLGVRYWRSSDEDRAVAPRETGPEPTALKSLPQREGGDAIESASALVGEDPEAAVASAYALARARLAAELGLPGPLTHREFLAACRADGLDADRLGALDRLTETYERASFAGATVRHASAEAAVEDARSLLGEP